MGALGTSKEVVASVSSVLALLRVWDCPALGILFHLSLGTQERPVRVLSPKPVGCENGFPTEDRSVKYFSKAVKEAAPSPDVRRGARGFLRPASPPPPPGLACLLGLLPVPKTGTQGTSCTGFASVSLSPHSHSFFPRTRPWSRTTSSFCQSP